MFAPKLVPAVGPKLARLGVVGEPRTIRTGCIADAVVAETRHVLSPRIWTCPFAKRDVVLFARRIEMTVDPGAVRKHARGGPGLGLPWDRGERHEHKHTNQNHNVGIAPLSRFGFDAPRGAFEPSYGCTLGVCATEANKDDLHGVHDNVRRHFIHPDSRAPRLVRRDSRSQR